MNNPAGVAPGRVGRRVGADQPVCWIAESIQAPPVGRTKV